MEKSNVSKCLEFEEIRLFLKKTEFILVIDQLQIRS